RLGRGCTHEGSRSSLQPLHRRCRDARHGRLRVCGSDPVRSGFARYPRHPGHLQEWRGGPAARRAGRRSGLLRQGRIRPGTAPRNHSNADRVAMAKTRVLVIEDSLTVRKRMLEVLAADPDIEIVGEADDGKRGIELCQHLRPDVVTLDMMLPVMGGLAVTEFIMAYCPTPILIVSASTNRGELFKTYEALAAGALDVLDKPLGNELDDAWEQKLVSTVKLISRIKVIMHPRARLGPMGRPPGGPASIEAAARGTALAAPVAERQALQREGRLCAVAIGVSTGGPAALIEILRGLPHGFPLPILLVIHIGKLFAPAFAEWLDGQSPLRVTYAADGDPLPPPGEGKVLVACPDRHLVLREGKLRLTQDPERHACRRKNDCPGRSDVGGVWHAEGSDPTWSGRAGPSSGEDCARAGRAGARRGYREADMKPRVLIVDDSLTVRMDIGEALQSAGFDTVLCADLRSAREALAREGSVLIVLDILLPDGDGLDFLKELRISPATAQIPVLLLSTEDDAKNRVRGMGAGADEYIGKPYDLKLLVARARTLTQADASGGVGLGRRVLVIDDSVTFRDELRQSLEGAGYHVREAASGEEGLALAAADRPDAVVVDGILPGIDGATVVRRLKSDTALRSTPCLLLTGTEGANDGLRALEAGADAYVRKSEDLGVILVRLAALLRGAIATGGETSPSLLGPKRLLAVDDSITYLQELGSQLRREGYHVVMASSGEEALELLAAQPVDGILLDLVMPGLSGQETCKRIKQRAEWRDIPLIMLTARDDRDAMIEGINAGADDYIAKSADFDVLKARLRAQLRRKYFEDENRRIREKLVRRET